MRRMTRWSLILAVLAAAAPTLALAAEDEKAAGGASAAGSPAEAASAEASASAQDDDSDSSETSSGQSVLRRKGALLDKGPQPRDQMLSGFILVPWYYGIGIGFGARYTLPILDEGFIPSLNDSLELEFGADLWAGTFISASYIGLAAPLAEGRWTFHITDKFDAYGKLSLGWSFNLGTFAGGNTPWAGFYWSLGPGVLYKFSDSMYARAELMSQGLHAGIGLTF